jgi:hypothetical protein
MGSQPENASEGASNVASEIFPHSSLAHVSGSGNPCEKLTANDRDCEKRNFKIYVLGCEKHREIVAALSRNGKDSNFKGFIQG